MGRAGTFPDTLSVSWSETEDVPQVQVGMWKKSLIPTSATSRAVVAPAVYQPEAPFPVQTISDHHQTGPAGSAQFPLFLSAL